MDLPATSRGQEVVKTEDLNQRVQGFKTPACSIYLMDCKNWKEKIRSKDGAHQKRIFFLLELIFDQRKMLKNILRM